MINILDSYVEEVSVQASDKPVLRFKDVAPKLTSEILTWLYKSSRAVNGDPALFLILMDAFTEENSESRYTCSALIKKIREYTDRPEFMGIEFSMNEKNHRLIMAVLDKDHAVERVNQLFTTYPKEIKRINEETIWLAVEYPRFDEKNIIDSLMSFGTAVQVISPVSAVNRVKECLQNQLSV